MGWWQVPWTRRKNKLKENCKQQRLLAQLRAEQSGDDGVEDESETCQTKRGEGR